MIRNDYRRALIMLRGLEKGYSGHVRLERRTLRGMLQFSVTTPSQNSGNLHAAVIGQRAGNYIALDLGELGHDGRGQAGLNAAIDPRNVLGADLDECLLLVVSAISENSVNIVLMGYLNGSCEINWSRLRDTITELYGVKENLAAENGVVLQPAEADIYSVEEDVPEVFTPLQGENNVAAEQLVISAEEISVNQSIGEEHAFLPGADNVAREQEYIGNNAMEEQMENATFIPQELIEMEAANEKNSHGQEDETEVLFFRDEFTEEEMIAQNQPEAFGSFEERDANEAGEPEKIQMDNIADAYTAQEEMLFLSVENNDTDLEYESKTAVFIDFDAAWPPIAFGLKELFMQNNPVDTLKEEGYIFVRAPMCSQTGYDHCIAGLHVKNGIPDVVCYAIPGEYGMEPPPGLEGYTWRAGENGSGFWVVFIDADSGEQML